MHLIYWLTYNCLLALAPVPMVAIYLWIRDAPVSLVKIVRDGQLFFYSASLSAAAVGDLLMPRHPLAVSPAGLALCVTGLGVCVFLSTWFFGVSSGAGSINDRKLASLSYTFTLGSTILVASMRSSLDLL